MKLICDCGTEIQLLPEGDLEDDERGQYVTHDRGKFSFWSGHDEAGIVCEGCGKAIWYFT